MRVSFGEMDGDSWEEYCHKILRQRHQDYQEVPAQFGGDLGIEGFIRSGVIFQCYCPDEDLNGIDLYEAQRDKITKDINKLVKNASKISKLGAGEITEWHFLTPRYNHRGLLTHCRKKESFVQDQHIQFISNKFAISLKVEDDYIAEREVILGTGGLRLQASYEKSTPDELDTFRAGDSSIVSNIEAKIHNLKLNPRQEQDLIESLVSGYVIGQYELENLHVKSPIRYISVLKLKSATERQLGIRMLSNSDNHGSILNKILREYEEDLRRDFSKSLSSALIKLLSTEAISDWLGRCPLRFPSNQNN